MRISDWSSDVCSSDLLAERGRQHRYGEKDDERERHHLCHSATGKTVPDDRHGQHPGCGGRGALHHPGGDHHCKTASQGGCNAEQHIAGDARQQNAPPSEAVGKRRSEEHTSELQSLMRISYAVFCLTKTTTHTTLST